MKNGPDDTETEVKKVKEKVSLNTAGGSDVEKKIG